MRFAISRRWMIFFTACLLFVLSQFYRASIAVIAPDLISDLGLDTRGLSLISASFFYTFAIMQIPISMYLDAIGPRIAMTALSLLGVAGALVFACLPPGTNLTVLSVLFFGFGFFTSSGQVMYAHIKERMPVERAGTAMTGVNFFTMVGVAAFLQGLGNLMQYLYPGESFGAPAFRVAFFSVPRVWF